MVEKASQPVIEERTGPKVSRRRLLQAGGAVVAAGAAALAEAKFRWFLSKEKPLEVSAIESNLQFVGGHLSKLVDTLSQDPSAVVHTGEANELPGQTIIDIPARGITITTKVDSAATHVQIQKLDDVKTRSHIDNTRNTSLTFSIDNHDKFVAAGAETTTFEGNPPWISADGSINQLGVEGQYLTLLEDQRKQTIGSLTIQPVALQRGENAKQLTTSPTPTVPEPLTQDTLTGFNQYIADAIGVVNA